MVGGYEKMIWCEHAVFFVHVGCALAPGRSAKQSPSLPEAPPGKHNQIISTVTHIKKTSRIQ